ncbi:MAG: methyltransferase domain-containing protein [Phycisphaerales bacterium]
MNQNTTNTAIADGSEYVLGTDGDESVRLGLQHRLWSESTHRLWERAGVQPGVHMLDLGCGPGHATIDLAQIVGPTGRIVGVDESAQFLKQLNDQVLARRYRNVERVLGDVQELEESFPGESSVFDVAYARWVFCFLQRPEDVVRGLGRLMKTGGRVAVQDYFNYDRSMTLAPRREAFSRVISAVAASWRSRGGDTDIMGRLPGMFARQGFRIDHLDVVQRIARPGTTMWHWPNAFWRTFTPRLVETGFITAADKEAFDQTWEQASKDPAAFIQLPPVYELIATKI